MGIEVRPFSGDARAFHESGETSFQGTLRDEDWAVMEPLAEADRAIAAYDGHRIVGTAGAFSFELTVPGGMLPAAGVTLVGVHATHRRRGILRRMMRAQLDQVLDRGEPLAILWASEGAIYQRFGYGLGALRMGISVERHRNEFRLPHSPAGDIRFVEVDEAKRLYPPIHDAIRPRRAGFFNRTPAFWDAEIFHDPEHRRGGAGPAWYVVHAAEGRPDGYARYRIRDQWDDSGPKSAVIVTELLATNPAAHLDLWRFLMDIDLMARVEAWNLASDDPILLSLAEPRALGMTLGDALWLRVVDVPAALGGRSYRADGRVVMEVSDEFMPANAGRWRLEVDGSARATSTTDAPDVGCDITDLGAAYLGAFSFAQLADAGRVCELAMGGLERADALFRTDRAPWCPRVF
ncbi:MAG TPA: GNAT family N-acetyltransferase [Candidatus Limnocylindria bacterium]